MPSHDHKPATLSAVHCCRPAPALPAARCCLALTLPAWAVETDKPPVGTWPAGTQGATVTIGASVPRTGAYATQGEDKLKGMQLAVEHINDGHELVRKIAPKISKGLLGKKVQLVVANSGAKPNSAVQEQQTFINENKIIAMTGLTSSAVAVALNKFAEREKFSISWRFPARTTRPARTARAIRSASVSTARRRPTRSDRCW